MEYIKFNVFMIRVNIIDSLLYFVVEMLKDKLKLSTSETSLFKFK